MSEVTIQPAADDRTDNADDDIRDDPAGRFTGHDPAGNQSHDEPEDDPRENSHKRTLLCSAKLTGANVPAVQHTLIMKRTLISLLAAFSLMTAGAAAAQPSDTEITASGTGTVALAPDVAMVNAAVETNAESAGDAISQNNARYDRIVEALAKLGMRAAMWRLRITT